MTKLTRGTMSGQKCKKSDKGEKVARRPTVMPSRSEAERIS
jgi:hypothetical protein